MPRHSCLIACLSTQHLSRCASTMYCNAPLTASTRFSNLLPPPSIPVIFVTRPPNLFKVEEPVNGDLLETGVLPADVSEISANKERIHVLEGALITWTKQIKAVLKQDPEQLLKVLIAPNPRPHLRPHPRLEP